MNRFLPIILSLCVSADAANVVSTVDGGGRRATSAHYAMSGSLGGIEGVSGSELPSITLKQGYIGQLYDVANIVVTVMPSSVAESSNAQLSVTATLDDGSILVVPGSLVSWSPPAYPIASVNSNGVVTPANVYIDTTGTLGGSYFGVSNSVNLLVLDTVLDDFGIYADDGIADSWQVQYFGLNNPNAAPTADVTGTGQDNYFKYVAGLDPTNPASVFVLKVARVPGQLNQTVLTWMPWASGRTYAPEFRTSLTSGSYTNLAVYTGPQTNAADVTVIDMSAVEPAKFYRIKISLP